MGLVDENAQKVFDDLCDKTDNQIYDYAYKAVRANKTLNEVDGDRFFTTEEFITQLPKTDIVAKSVFVGVRDFLSREAYGHIVPVHLKRLDTGVYCWFLMPRGAAADL